MDGPVATFVFHGDIRQFISPGNKRRGELTQKDIRAIRQSGRIVTSAARSASLKDAIEALGVPHTEVGHILADGESANFSHSLTPDCVYDVHPQASPVDVTQGTALCPTPFQRTAFIADVNVGALARLLRLLGLDTAFLNTLDDAEIARISADEKRIVLTRDRALLKRSAVIWGRLIRAEDAEAQLLETLTHFGISGPFKPFSRCIHCNARLVPVDKAAIIHRLLPLTRKYFNQFHSCPACDKIYWAGSHHEAMLRRLSRLGLAITE